MIEFNLWYESFIFAFVYAIIIIVPCVLVALLGRNMINQLGHYPTRSPIIQMSIFAKLMAIEIMTFACLIGFYHFFNGK